MKVRRLVVAFAALIAGPAFWAANADPAHAGGPTSVLLSNPADGRVGALYHTSADYQMLVDIVGADGSTIGETDHPAAVREEVNDAYRLTWMIHDMRVWRIDLLFETADGFWIETRVDPAGGSGDPFATAGRWTLVRDKAAIKAVFRHAGLLGTSLADTAATADPEPEVVTGAADTTTAGPGAGLLAAGAGLAGLVIGAAGMWAFRRARTADRRPKAVLTG